MFANGEVTVSFIPGNMLLPGDVLHSVLKWNEELAPVDCTEDGLAGCLSSELGQSKCNFSICGLNLAVIHVADVG